MWHHHNRPQMAFDRFRSYDRQPHQTGKPAGLWLAFETDGGRDAWWDWTEAEGGAPKENWRTAFRLIDRSKLLSVAAPSEVPQRFRCRSVAGGWTLDIAALRQTHAGMMIPAYTRGSPDDDQPAPTWWYAWDCSSACIWDLSAVAMIDGSTEQIRIRQPDWH